MITELDPPTKLVKGHEYGNGAAILTRDGDAAREFATGIRAGAKYVMSTMRVKVLATRRPEATCR